MHVISFRFNSVQCISIHVSKHVWNHLSIHLSIHCSIHFAVHVWNHVSIHSSNHVSIHFKIISIHVISFLHSFVRSFIHSCIHSFPFIPFHCFALHSIPFIHSLFLSLSLCLRRYCSANDWPCLRSEVRFGKYCRSSTGLLDTFGVRIWKCLEPVLGISLGKAPHSTLSCVRWRVEAAACHKTCLAESNFVVPVRRIWETQNHMNTSLHDITCIMPRYDVHMSPYVSLLAVLNVRKVNKCANHTHVKFGLTWQ